MSEGYQINFNQDFTSVSVINNNGFRVYSINGNGQVEEIYAEENERVRFVERYFNSSLVLLVTEQKPNCLRTVHLKKKEGILSCVYGAEILCLRVSRHRIVVSIGEIIHIQDMRNMEVIHTINNIPPNWLGLCALSPNSQLAFPIWSTTGELRIFDAYQLKAGLTIKAHNTQLSALTFNSGGTLLATTSERGTVIRVFCVRSGQRVQEFRRGVKRCVRIASLVFVDNFVCASSNTETVHIFKLDSKLCEASPTAAITRTATTTAECKELAVLEKKEKANKGTAQQSIPGKKTKSIEANKKTDVNTTTTTASTSPNSGSGGGGGGGWSDYLSKAVSSYLIPTQVSDVLAQDRAFATAMLKQPGLKHVCALRRIQKELKLYIACEDGFLQVYDFDKERGGSCKLERLHDLRYALEDVIEVNLTESMSELTTTAEASVAKSGSNVTMPMVTTPMTPPIDSPAIISITASTSGASSCTIEAKRKARSGSMIIENPEPVPDFSYAGVLKGDQAGSTMTDSAQFRKLCDALDTPTKLYDEIQFPPVAVAARE